MERKKSLFRKKIFIIPFSLLIIIVAALSLIYHYRTPIMISLLREKTLPVVVVSGTWEEMGYQVASNPKFSKNIHRLAGMFKSSFPPEKALSYYEKIKELIPKDIIEQMRGMAKGLSEANNISFEEGWNDVLIWNFFMVGTYIRGCTAFAVNTGKELYLAHNTDLPYLYSFGGAIIIFNPKDTGKYSFVSYYQPSFVGATLTENETGLAIVFNAAYPTNRDYGLPPEMFIRKVIEECSSVDEVISSFKSFIENGGKFAHNGCILTLMDFKTGKMARIEVAPDRIEYEYGWQENDKQYLVSTNHYRLMPERNGKDDFNTSSYARFERCNMLVKLQKNFSQQTILKILSDHDGQDHGTAHTICRHEDINKGTIDFIYFDSNFTLYYIEGHPCDYWHNKSLLQKVKWKEILQKTFPE
ncbi:MAG: hypothetical protein D6734_05665 [Candidatus Schekmanbacteria bacterium]|nr:MAG: hypothetical protein D6734_05665 [Candidatus Schekmanbacteria bacterium]